MKSNTAAWIMAPKMSSLEVREATYPMPGPKEVVVRTAAVAVNPLEYMIQDYNPPIGGRTIQYPTILGSDLAGVIISVGSEVTVRNIGDRVIGNARGISIGKPAESAFQDFVVLQEKSTTPIPKDIPFEAAAVLPLACDTAMAGLFTPNQLGLSTARLGGTNCVPPSSGLVILIWGGSSSVGCCATQMASVAGYEVYTVASTRNHALCYSLGATKVFDQAEANLEDSVVAELRGKTLVGALDCIADKDKTIVKCARILSQTNGRKKAVTVLTPPEADFADGVELQRLSIPSLQGTSTYDVVHAWMAVALENGTLQPKPDPMIVGEGLESIQLGLDTVRKGVSASKVVIRLRQVIDS